MIRSIGIVVSLVLAVLNLAAVTAQYDWEISLLDGFPAVTFDSETNRKEIVFKYNVTEEESDTMDLAVRILSFDCESPADEEAFDVTDRVGWGEYDVEVEIVQDVIVNTLQYEKNEEGTGATIRFCVRYVLAAGLFVCCRTGATTKLSYQPSKFFPSIAPRNTHTVLTSTTWARTDLQLQ